MEKYKGLEDGKTYIVIDYKETDNHFDAMKIANKHFKTAIRYLDYDIGFVWKDLLYFNLPHPNAKMVFVVWKR